MPDNDPIPTSDASTSARAEPPAALATARRVVVKIGSRALVDERYAIDEHQLGSLVSQMAELRRTGREVICVSSGAVAAGLADLRLGRRPRDLPSLQAAAAAGQARLIGLYRRFFSDHGLSIAQVLLTHADLRSRERHLNARNTLSRLLRAGLVPVINENDTVAVDEIRVGDNDLLSALVACLVRADALILLTTADGLLTHAPDERGHNGGEVIATVEHITDELRAIAGSKGDDVAIGGMLSKLQAAETVTRAGERAVIANGRSPDVLLRLLAGEALGTHFVPRSQGLRGRQRWIAFFDHPQGALHLDTGAVAAVRDRGSSLLAIGIRAVDGSFQRGSPVRLLDEAGLEFARGLVNYPAAAIERIRGRRSDAIASILGTCEHEEVIHRDNLVLA